MGRFVYFSVLCLLAFRDTVLKSKFLLALGAHKKRCDSDTFRAVCPSKQGKTQTDKSTLFYPLISRGIISTSDFQSEVGEVFGEIGCELPAKFGRRFSSFFCWEDCQKHFPPKLHRKFHHQTSLRGSGLQRALELKGTNSMRQTEPNSQFFFRRCLLIFAWPGNYIISEAQHFAEKHRFSQNAGDRRILQKPVCPFS